MLNRLLVRLSALVLGAVLLVPVAVAPPAAADGAGATIGMPFTGWWDRYGVAHPSYHAGNNTAVDWAVDIYQGAGTQVRPRMSGPGLALKVSSVRATCGSAGQTVTIDVHTSGQYVGVVRYGHLSGVTVAAEQWISPDTVIGQLAQYPYQSGCWEVSSAGGVHTHVTGYNLRGYSCYHDVGSGAYLAEGHAIGIVGGNYAVARQSPCSGTAGNPPIGGFDAVSSPEAGRVNVRGWAIDDDARTAAVTIHAYVGGQAGDPGVEGYDLGGAGTYRPDVGVAHPGAGDYHGFDTTVTTAKIGSVPVCIYAIDIGGVDNRLLGCAPVNVEDPNPIGALDAAEGLEGRFRVVGWAADRNGGSTPRNLHVYLGGPAGTPGAQVYDITTNRARDDIAAAHPWAGPMAGFNRILITAKRGRHEVCVYAINVGPGANRLLSCQSVLIRLGEIEVEQRPAVRGRPVVGRVVRADPGTYSVPNVTYSYQWYAGRTVISRATGPELLLRRRYRGVRVSVRVTATRQGFTSATARSPRVMVR